MKMKRLKEKKIRNEYHIHIFSVVKDIDKKITYFINRRLLFYIKIFIKCYTALKFSKCLRITIYFMKYFKYKMQYFAN